MTFGEFVYAAFCKSGVGDGAEVGVVFKTSHGSDDVFGCEAGLCGEGFEAVGCGESGNGVVYFDFGFVEVGGGGLDVNYDVVDSACFFGEEVVALGFGPFVFEVGIGVFHLVVGDCAERGGNVCDLGLGHVVVVHGLGVDVVGCEEAGNEGAECGLLDLCFKLVFLGFPHLFDLFANFGGKL